MACENFDVLIVCDYSTIDENIEKFTSYKEINLIAWSMGVFVAYLLKDKLPKFNKKIAINGTPLPVNDEFGIPVKPFLLTLRHARTGLEGKFYQNIFDDLKEAYANIYRGGIGKDAKEAMAQMKMVYNNIASYIHICAENGTVKGVPVENV